MLLSVVVTIVEGGPALERCLQALAGQEAPPFLETLVPWDDSVSGIPALQERFPGVRFLAMGAVPTAHPITRESGRHELYDRRRAAGLAAAEGAVVAMLEDRGAPRPDWARKVVDLHRRLPHPVIGGAIENAVDRPWNRALWFCDFGRYQLPLPAGPAPCVSDTNVSYKRDALWSVHELWRQRYHETTVHGALRAAGQVLYLAPELVVEQRRAIPGLARLMAERFHWARLYAAVRAREVGVLGAVVLALGSPLLPAVLLLRQLVRQLDQRRLLGAWLRSAPHIALLLLAWSAGELWGYVTRRP